MLENLTGEGVNSSGNLDCIHISCYESLSKGYNECIRPPSLLGLSEKIAPWQPSENHLSVILVSQQRREPFVRVHSSGKLVLSCIVVYFAWSRKKEKFTQM